jgi:hypothetical protein
MLQLETRGQITVDFAKPHRHLPQGAQPHVSSLLRGEHLAFDIPPVT